VFVIAELANAPLEPSTFPYKTPRLTPAEMSLVPVLVAVIAIDWTSVPAVVLSSIRRSISRVHAENVTNRTWPGTNRDFWDETGAQPEWQSRRVARTSRAIAKATEAKIMYF